MGIHGEDGEKTLPFGLNVSPKDVQPRVVFTLLLIGSAAGIWLSRWGDSLLSRGFWWLLIVALGSLCGGLYWRLVLFDTVDFESDDTARTVSKRWRQVKGLAVAGFLLGGVGSIATGAVGRPLDIGELAIVVGVILVPLLCVTLSRYPDCERPEPTILQWLFFATVLGSLLGFSWTETNGRPLEWAVRTGHIASFALWIGGASWHNFIVLPSVHARPNAADEIKTGARQFRRHLPAVITVFFLTGAYQAIRLLGFSFSALVGTPAGRLVAVKFVVLFVLTGLVVINLRRARKKDDPDE